MKAISAVLKKQIIIKRENISAVVALRIHGIGLSVTGKTVTPLDHSGLM